MIIQWLIPFHILKTHFLKMQFILHSCVYGLPTGCFTKHIFFFTVRITCLAHNILQRLINCCVKNELVYYEWKYCTSYFMKDILRNLQFIFYRYMMKMNYSKSSWISWAKQIWWIMQLTFGSSCIQMRKFQRLVNVLACPCVDIYMGFGLLALHYKKLMYRQFSTFVHYILPPQLPFVHGIQSIIHHLMNIPAKWQFIFICVAIVVYTAVYVQLYKYFVVFCTYYFIKMKVMVLVIIGVGLINFIHLR